MNRCSGPAPIVSVDAASTRSRRATLPDLRITDVAYGPGFTATRHEHEHDCVTLVLEGAVAKELRATKRTLGIGAVAITPAAAPHADRFGARGGRVLVVELLRPAKGFPRTSLPSDSTRTESLRLVWLGRRIAAELIATDDAASLALHAATLELLAIVNRSRSAAIRVRQAWMDDVIDHLHAHLFKRVTLAELAAVGGVHRAHLVRSFRARFGVSVGAYVRRARIEWAAEALVADESSIAQIAARAGFVDQSHFTRTFIQHIGVPPSRYRAAAASSLRSPEIDAKN